MIKFAQTVAEVAWMNNYCPECVETRLHPQPFIDNAGRLLCGSCWFIDGQEIEMMPSEDIFPPDITGESDAEFADK